MCWWFDNKLCFHVDPKFCSKKDAQGKAISCPRVVSEGVKFNGAI